MIAIGPVEPLESTKTEYPELIEPLYRPIRHADNASFIDV